MISSLTLEFVCLVDGCPQDGNASLRIETDGIAIHSRILVDNPSVWARLQLRFRRAQRHRLAVEILIGSTISLHVQTSTSISLKVGSALHLIWSYLGFHVNPSQKSVVEHLPNNVLMTLCCTANSDAGPSTSTFGTQVMTRVLVTTAYVMTVAPGKSVVDLQVDSVRKAFALQCEVHTAAVTFESKPLVGVPRKT